MTKSTARDFFKGVELGDYDPNSIRTVNELIMRSKASKQQLCEEITQLREFETNQVGTKNYEGMKGTLSPNIPVEDQDKNHALEGMNKIDASLISELMDDCSNPA